MMHHTYVLENLVQERRASFTREAESHRLACRAKRSRFVKASPLKRITWAVYRLLNVHYGPAAGQDPALTK